MASFRNFEERVGSNKEYQDLLYLAHQAAPQGKTCPSCRRLMKPLKTEQNQTPLDVCFPCQHVWFDFMEYEKFRVKADILGEAFVKMRQAEKSEIHLGEIHAATFLHNPIADISDARFYEPLIVNSHKIKKFPFVTYAIILVSLVTFIKFRKHVPDLWLSAAYYQGLPMLESVKRLFTSFFVHGSWGHLLGNLFFIFFCSAEAEDASPLSDFLLVVFGGHVLGILLQAFFSEPGYIGGASAGVFSLLTYYAFLFPNARMNIFPEIYERRRFDFNTVYLRLSFPIHFFVVFKILIEILFTLGPRTGIAHLAHLGGAVVGAIIGIIRSRKI